MDAAAHRGDAPAEPGPTPGGGLNILVPLLAQSWESQGAEWCLTLMFVSWEPEATNSTRVEIQAADVGFVSHKCAKD